MKFNKSQIYTQLQGLPFSVGEKDLVQYLDLARLDPRLMEVCTEFLRDFWYLLDPALLNKRAKSARHPFMIKAALVLIHHYCSSENEHSKEDFTKWMSTVLRGLKDPPPQLLYVGTIPIASKLMTRTLEQALPELLKHNLIEKDLPFNKGQPKSIKDKLWAQQRYPLELMKADCAAKIKQLKTRHLKNDSIIQSTGVNRLFLSKILNNKLEGISLEYLLRTSQKAETLLSTSA